MNVALGTGEKVIKSWDYAKAKGILFTKGTGNLTVTDRRVISATETKKSLTRDEMPLSAITGISTGYYSNFSILFVLLGVLLCLTLVLIPLGIILIQKGTGTTLCVILDGNIPNDPIIATTSIRRRRKAKRLRIKVNKSCAKEIAEQLSTIIFVDLKS